MKTAEDREIIRRKEVEMFHSTLGVLEAIAMKPPRGFPQRSVEQLSFMCESLKGVVPTYDEFGMVKQVYEELIGALEELKSDGDFVQDVQDLKAVASQFKSKVDAWHG